MCRYVYQIARCGCRCGDVTKNCCNSNGTECKITIETKLEHNVCETCTEIIRSANTNFDKIEVDVKRVREMISDAYPPARGNNNKKGFEILLQFDSCIESLKEMLAEAYKELAELKADMDEEE
jgi:hypothetical protein